jgi:hypothetical protein
MSMNFAREQSLLRQRLQAKGQPALAASLQQQHGTAQTFLGADDTEITAAADALAGAYPQMGRAQMTAFVRTLWSSRIHELRAVGVQLLAARAALLEAPDLPLFEGFLRDEAADPVHAQLARDVVGALVVKNRKAWKDLKRFAGDDTDRMRRAAVRAAQRALAADADAFPRFVDLVAPLLASTDAVLQGAIDDVLVAAAERHGDAVRAFVQQHQRKVSVPKAKPKPPPPVPPPVPPNAVEPAPAKPLAKKPAAGKRATPVTAAAKPAAAKKPKAAAAKVAKAPAKAKAPSRSRGR